MYASTRVTTKGGARRLLFARIGAYASASFMGCGGGDHRPAVWEYISPAILQPSCATASCHSPAAAAAGLDFSDPDRGYTSLTGLWVWIVDPEGDESKGCRRVDGIMVCQRPRRPMVAAHNPAQSRLVHVLRARNAPRMPPDRPLTEADIALIERWILNGAERQKTRGDAGPYDGAASDAARDGDGLGGRAAMDASTGDDSGG